MKKILLTTVALATLSSTAFANDLIENQIYLRGGFSGSHLPKFKDTLGDRSVSIKPKFTPGIEIGAGMYVMENVRVELVYDHPFISDLTGSLVVNEALPTAPALPIVGRTYLKQVEVKHKPTIHALFARAAVDVIDLGVGKVFITGGVGWSRVSDSINITAKGLEGITPVPVPAPAPGAPVPPPVTTKEITRPDTFKAKMQNNMAWMLGAGVSFEIFEGGALEVRGDVKGYGKSKGGESDKYKIKFEGKNFIEYSGTLGIRVSL